MRRSALAAVVVSTCGALLTGGCGLGIQDLPMGRSVPGDNYTVTLQLAHADGILVGADVRTGQRVIGRVARLSTDTVGAAVDLNLSTSVELPANVEAAVELPSALGSPFVRLRSPSEPSATLLTNGDVIVESRTEIGPQIENVLATLGTVLTGSGFEQMRTVIGELNTAFADRPGEVRNLIDTMTVLTATASEHQSDFDAAIDRAQSISRQLVEQQQVLDGFLEAAPEATAVLAEQRDRLAALLDSSSRLAARADTILSSTDPGGMLVDAAAVVETLRSYNSRMGETLVNMNAFMASFDRAVQGDYLLFDGILDIPAGLEYLMTGPVAPPTPGGGDSLQSLLTGGAE